MTNLNLRTIGYSLIAAGLGLFASLFVGCTASPFQHQEVVTKAFTNQYSEVKATTKPFQFIVRCVDGSIWEVNTSEGTFPMIAYKNCLFDPLYRVSVKPMVPLFPISLEKIEDTNGIPNPY